MPHFIYQQIINKSLTVDDSLNHLYVTKTLEDYLPLNRRLDNLEFDIEHRKYKNVPRRIYQLLRRYHQLESSHMERQALVEPIDRAIINLLNKMVVNDLGLSTQLNIYQFVTAHFADDLLKSTNPAWQQKVFLQPVYQQLILTNLDIAIQEQDTAKIKLLVQLGAGQQVKLPPLLKFYKRYQHDPEWQQTFEQLRTVNKAFAWRSSLDRLFPPRPSDPMSPLPGYPITFAQIKPLQRYIPLAIWSQICDENYQVHRINREGRRSVACVQASAAWPKVYLKFQPELPGFEAAISTLMNQDHNGLGRHLVPYSELAKVVVNGQAIPCLLSQGINGLSLAQILRERDQSNAGLQQLDLAAYSRLLMATLLIAPEDGSPSNYIVEPQTNNQVRIVAIDNDHALAEPLTKEVQVDKKVKCRPQVKSILYCFDQVNESVDATVKADLVTTDFFKLLENWLTELSVVNQAYQRLFPDPDRLIQLYTDKMYPCFIGIPFKTQMIAKLYNRCLSLQQFLTDQGDRLPTHFEIIQAVEPYLAQRYAPALALHKTKPLLERFKALDGKYFTDQEGYLQSSTTINILLTSLGLKIDSLADRKKLIDEVRTGHHLGPARALDELRLERIVMANQDRDLRAYQSLKTPAMRAQFLRQLKSIAVTMEASWLETINHQDAVCDQLDLHAFTTLQNHHVLKRPNLSSLTHLWIAGCRQITDNLIGELAKSTPHLQLFDGSRTQLTAFAQAGYIFWGSVEFAQLKILSLAHCPQLSRIDLLAPKLLELNVNESPRLEVMSGDWPKLKVANCQGCSQLTYGDLLQRHPGYPLSVYITIANLPQHQQAKWQPFFDTTLIQLDLSSNEIGGVSATALAWALKVNTKLTQVNLEQNQIGDASATELAGALKDNKSLTQLDLKFNQIGAVGATALAGALKDNKTLTQLNLWANRVSAIGATALANALKDNKTLIQLDLKFNQIGAVGATALAGALKDNKTLTQLYLKFNQIGAVGATALAGVLKANTTLTDLDLDVNQIGDYGATQLADALKVNTTLTCLNIRGSQIVDIGATQLADALKVNTTLTELSLEVNKISADLKLRIDKHLGTNRIRAAQNSVVSFIALYSSQVLQTSLADEIKLLSLDHQSLTSLPSQSSVSYIDPSSAKLQEQPCFNLLSIDGSGIRGLIPAIILDRLQYYTKKPLHSLFDCIGGSSSGALLSLGLTMPDPFDDTRARYQPNELVTWFNKDIVSVFKTSLSNPSAPFYQVKYNANSFEKFLQAKFGNATFSAALTPTLVTSCLIAKPDIESTELFNSYEAQQDQAKDFAMWEIARATSIVPYFPTYDPTPLFGFESSPDKTKGRHALLQNVEFHADRGFYDSYRRVNNPTRLIYNKFCTDMADRQLQVTPENCLVISLGTGQYNSKDNFQKTIKQKDDEIQEHFLKHFPIGTEKNYQRINPMLRQDIALDDTRQQSLDYLADAAHKVCQDMDIEQVARRLVNNKTACDPKELW